MKKLSVQMTKGLLSLGAITFAVVASPAFAQNLATSVTTVRTGLLNIPNIIAGVCYIAGAAVLGAGLMKLKAHAENASQTPIGQGLWPCRHWRHSACSPCDRYLGSGIRWHGQHWGHIAWPRRNSVSAFSTAYPSVPESSPVPRRWGDPLPIKQKSKKL